MRNYYFFLSQTNNNYTSEVHPKSQTKSNETSLTTLRQCNTAPLSIMLSGAAICRLIFNIYP